LRARAASGRVADRVVEESPTMKPAKWVMLLLVAALLGLAAAWWLTRPVVVPAVALKAAPLVRNLQFSARVATAMRVDVGSTVTGRVQDVPAVEGANVRRGELLVQLEASELRAALQQAQAGERQAAARLAGLRSTGRGVAQAGVAQADSVLVAARAELQRTQELVNQGFVSASRLDDARRAVAVAQAQQAAAEAQRQAIGDQGSDVVQAQAQLALAQAASVAAQARLAQTEITAPADARVLARQVEPGQIVQPGKALVGLALSGPLQVVAQVDERYLDQLRVGQTASVIADAFAGQRFEATVLSIAPLVDAQRGAIEVKLGVAKPPPFLREDMTLSVSLETARREQALAVPVAALRNGPTPDKARVWIASDGRAEDRELSLGLRTLEAAEVLGGATAGEVVLLRPALQAGTRVKADTSVHPSVLLRPAGELSSGAAAITNTMGR
jgi:HlyD family secretion protein